MSVNRKISNILNKPLQSCRSEPCCSSQTWSSTDLTLSPFCSSSLTSERRKTKWGLRVHTTFCKKMTLILGKEPTNTRSVWSFIKSFLPTGFLLFTFPPEIHSKDKLTPLIKHLIYTNKASYSGHHLHYPSPSWSGCRFGCFWPVSPETRQTSERRGSAAEKTTVRHKSHVQIWSGSSPGTKFATANMLMREMFRDNVKHIL